MRRGIKVSIVRPCTSKSFEAAVHSGLQHLASLQDAPNNARCVLSDYIYSKEPLFHTLHGTDIPTPQIGVHLILTFMHEEYGRGASLENLKDQFFWHGPTELAEHPPSVAQVAPESELHDHHEAPPHTEARRANATLLMLARNSDIDGAVSSVRAVEDRFNAKFGYPWVFLNEVPFSDEFRRCALFTTLLSFG